MRDQTKIGPQYFSVSVLLEGFFKKSSFLKNQQGILEICCFSWILSWVYSRVYCSSSNLSLWLNLHIKGLLLVLWMSIFALSGISLKLSRLFLKICKWVLVKMSFSCKFSGLNSKSSANFKVKKAQEPLGGSNYFGWKWTVLFFMWILVVVIGFIWVLYGSKHGPLRGEVDTELSLGKAPILQHFNVSKEQLHVLVSSFFESDQVLHLLPWNLCSFDFLPFRLRLLLHITSIYE